MAGPKQIVEEEKCERINAVIFEHGEFALVHFDAEFGLVEVEFIAFDVLPF